MSVQNMPIDSLSLRKRIKKNKNWKKRNKKRKKELPTECGICNKEDNLIAIPCHKKHRFCRECLANIKKDTCPFCRKSFNNIYKSIHCECELCEKEKGENKENKTCQCHKCVPDDPNKFPNDKCSHCNSPDELISLPCNKNHLFCKKCLESKIKESCPRCGSYFENWYRFSAKFD